MQSPQRIVIIRILMGVGAAENGGPQFFLVELGGIEKSKGELWGGSFLIKVTNFYLPYFGIMLEGGS